MRLDMSQVLRLTDRNFEQDVFQSEVPVMVDFWASWCPPCKMADPVIEELAGEYTGTVKFGKINVDQNPGTATQHQVTGVPTFILFNSGKVVARRVGVQSKEQLKEMLGKPAKWKKEE